MFLDKVPMAQLAIGVGVITAVAWVALDGTLPLIISMLGGGLIALKATSSRDT